MSNALYVAGGITLTEFGRLMGETLDEAVRWEEFLAGRRDPSPTQKGMSKIGKVEERFPGAAKCWNSPIWKIQRERWLSPDELAAAIDKLPSPISSALTVFRMPVDVGVLRLPDEAVRQLAGHISFEALEALVLLANFAWNARSLELAQDVQAAYQQLSPKLKNLPEVGKVANKIFPHFDSFLKMLSGLLRRQRINRLGLAM